MVGDQLLAVNRCLGNSDKFLDVDYCRVKLADAERETLAEPGLRRDLNMRPTNGPEKK